MVEGGNSKKVRERDVPRVNEPSEAECPEEIAEKISERSRSEPERIDGSQKSIKVPQRYLEEKK